MSYFFLAVTTIFSGIAAIILACHSARKRANPLGLPLPPGPRGLPILGSAFAVNPTTPWLTYTDWSAKYGDIIYTSSLGQDYIIINSVKVTRALLEQRSSIYSDRPPPTLYKLFGIDVGTALLGYSDQWKLHRKLFHLTLRPEAATRYRDLYMRKARELVLNIMHNPNGSYEQLEVHLSNYSSSLVMAVTYGWEVSQDASLATRLRKLTDIFTKELTVERGVLLAAFPLREHLPAWFPGMHFKRQTAYGRQLITELRDIPFNYVKERVAAGTNTGRSMVSDFFESYEEGGIDADLEGAMKDTAFSVSIGGADTTSFSLLVFVLAMVLYPEVQDRAQAEIDAFVGSDQLPDFGHRSSLPYTEALLLEILRWRPISPLVMPHATTASDTYDGYYIPKGRSNSLPNMSRTLYNPEDADRFNPERHLLPNGQVSTDEPFADSPAFGFGRRACPGRFFVEGSMWAAVVTMLATLRFSKVLDADGREIEVKPEFTTGFVIHPLPFQCSVTSRSAERQKAMRVNSEST
ncbi:cytochrome P450 [Leucogyrophana mollusca]|uniref:Cytochrome P450 n=1 Tax=Leucogyrophana mollusca TaxID=85980 RepID=A0ACB8B4U1_9AGAM|nr:cytochrome P450 [Leucogyrophana mollusca]